MMRASHRQPGFVAALLHRERTGEGQVVETSLLRGSAHLMSYFYTEYWLDGKIRQPMGTANHLSVPNQLFPTADGSVVIPDVLRKFMNAERIDPKGKLV